MHVLRPLLAVLALGASAPLLANAFGATGYTQRDLAGGCGGCHSPQNAALNVSFNGPTAMLPGQTQPWTVAIAGTPSASAKAGFSAAIQKTNPIRPTFSNIAGQATVTGDMSTQASHGSGQGALAGFTTGSATYQVNVTMPANAVLGNTYLMYVTANVGIGAGAVGWKHGSTVTLTVAAPVPQSLTANQAGATATSIPLAWSGTQGEHFRVLRKNGGFPTGPNDAAATQVYEGANTSATAAGLTAGTQYYFAAYGKVPNAVSFSSGAATATAGTTPANPTALTAMSGSSSEVNLAWNGTAAEFKLLRKTGAYPSDPNDAGAVVVYEGTAKSDIDGGLAAGTQYFYRVWGKTPGTQAFSALSAQATATTAAQPMERHVAAGGNDQGGANACTVLAAPCRSITRAMAASGSGDSIFVQPGSYTVAGGEVFPIAFKNGVRLLATGSPADTFIDGSGDNVRRGLFTNAGNTSALTRLQGFTLRNGVRTDVSGGSALGGALYIASGANGTFTVSGNRFENNQVLGADADGSLGQSGSLGWGGAIYVFSSNVVIENNVFRANLARGGAALDHPATSLSGNENGGQATGGAIFFGGTGRVINNTFVANQARGGDGGTASNGIGDSGTAAAGALWASGNPSPSVVNNVFVGNAALSGAGGVDTPPQAGALIVNNAPAFTNNLVFGNVEENAASVGDSLGQAAVQADPVFHSAQVLRLRRSSPANGAGTAVNAPAIDLDEAPRPAPPSIGAYEASFLPQALQFGATPVLSAGSTDTVTVAAGGSSAPVLLASTTPGTCSVAGFVVTGLAAGTCTLTANQAGDVDYTAAPQASLSFAVSAQPVFRLTVLRAGAGSGSVASTPNGIACGADCAANYAANTVVTLSASAHPGSVFAGWSGACSGSAACQVTMSQAREVTANFAPDAQQATRVFIDGFED